MGDTLEFENRLYHQGYSFIAGVDEVGRGPLCGSVVSAAVILPKGFYNCEIKDSKKLSEKKREKIFQLIKDNAISIGVGIVEAKEIDRINIKEATKLAMKIALENLDIRPDYILIDAEKIEYSVPSMSIIKGDVLSQSIAAASIIAKVTRDRMCVEWHNSYPQYNIIKHKGYGTKEHIEAIKNNGSSPIHRVSFLRNILK
jgi:ribonuclease HII